MADYTDGSKCQKCPHCSCVSSSVWCSIFFSKLIELKGSSQSLTIKWEDDIWELCEDCYAAFEIHFWGKKTKTSEKNSSRPSSVQRCKKGAPLPGTAPNGHFLFNYPQKPWVWHSSNMQVAPLGKLKCNAGSTCRWIIRVAQWQHCSANHTFHLTLMKPYLNFCNQFGRSNSQERQTGAKGHDTACASIGTSLDLVESI